MPVCEVCFRHCRIEEGEWGFCGVRTAENGKVIAGNYGRLTAMALDPIEKKPLRHFHPGSLILSVGSYGCNLRCPFCQNYEISWSEEAMAMDEYARYVSPEELADTAFRYKNRGNIGVAFTYNEPLIGYEYVLDTARLVHETGMANVLVTNGTADLSVLEKLAPYVDAMNIDLKGYTHRYYREILKGDLDMVKDFIREAAKVCHIELTTLIIPGENDSEEEIRDLADFVCSLKDGSGQLAGPHIPLHISRFFPTFLMTDRPATRVKKVYRLAEVAREKLRYVYTGNC